ncbi:mycothiol transferase [Micromonospora aurantiaca (nom. illeg.)]
MVRRAGGDPGRPAGRAARAGPAHAGGGGGQRPRRDRRAPGERWDGADPASLERVLFHLVQEYARHLGHLDIVAELAGGPTGE